MSANSEGRTKKELDNLFKDPRYSRQAWRSIGLAIANSPCTRPISCYDKDGNPTLASDIEMYSYQKLKNDIDSLGKENREPTEIEMILQCQLVRARYDTAAATFIRDTLGAKPVDESKVDATVNNPYESLTDEELEMLAKYREEHKALPEAPATSPIVEADNATN